MSYRNGVGDLFLKALEGAAPEQSLLRPGDGSAPSEQKVPGDWSSDGKLIAYWSERPETRGDVWVQTIDGSQKAVALARTRSNERRPRFSPDSRFIAYESDETGTYEIYVQPFPPTGGKWQISVGGGSDVAWRGDGAEMYFMDGTGMLVAVPVRTSVARLRGRVAGSAVFAWASSDAGRIDPFRCEARRSTVSRPRRRRSPAATHHGPAELACEAEAPLTIMRSDRV